MYVHKLLAAEGEVGLGFVKDVQKYGADPSALSEDPGTACALAFGCACCFCTCFLSWLPFCCVEKCKRDSAIRAKMLLSNAKALENAKKSGIFSSFFS